MITSNMLSHYNSNDITEGAFVIATLVMKPGATYAEAITLLEDFNVIAGGHSKASLAPNDFERICKGCTVDDDAFAPITYGVSNDTAYFALVVELTIEDESTVNSSIHQLNDAIEKFNRQVPDGYSIFAQESTLASLKDELQGFETWMGKHSGAKRYLAKSDTAFTIRGELDSGKTFEMDVDVDTINKRDALPDHYRSLAHAQQQEQETFYLTVAMTHYENHFEEAQWNN